MPWRSSTSPPGCWRADGEAAGSPRLARVAEAAPDTYELFRRGIALLERGDHHAAIVALAKVREHEPGKDSVHEAYGRALFGARRFAEAAAEFAAVSDHDPTNHYALFCRGRALQQLGRHDEARAPLTQAARLAPERDDYRRYLEMTLRHAGA